MFLAVRAANRVIEESGPVSENNDQKFVYDFTEGNRDLKDLLGGKGANLAEMTNLGLPVPPASRSPPKRARSTSRAARSRSSSATR